MTVRRFAAATAAAIFLLLGIGGLVNPTGSSLACPDWPLCFGSPFPKMVGGVLYEHSHRLAATGVGILTIVLALLLARDGRRKLGVLALALVVAQGVLGGLTVLLKLPPQISIAHLALSMAFFVYVVWLALPAAIETTPRLHRWLVAGFGLIYVQIVLGAVVRHTHSALACINEVPLCFGQIWPENAPVQTHIHMLHRLFALVAGGVAAGAAIAAARRLSGRLRLVALAVPALIVGQIALGVWTVLTLKALVPVELHLAVGALLLAATATLALATRAPAPARATSLRDLFSLTKPRISLLSVATAAVGLALAHRTPDAAVLLCTLAGTWLLVGSANTLNMYLEREIDGRMARTRRRPLPAGRMRPEVALGFGIAQALIAVPMLTFGANALTGLLGALALVLYVLVYTPLKRTTIHALLIGAIPGAMPPLLGWTAAAGSLSLGALALFGVIFFWQIPHFLAIAMFQRDDYRAAGLKVLPVERGDAAARRTIVYTLGLQVLVTLLLVPLGLGDGAYLAGAALLGAFMIGWGVYGLTRAGGRGWARGLFLVSIAYLPILFALLVAA
jgi:protoheme IX farnesyltransferase